MSGESNPNSASCAKLTARLQDILAGQSFRELGDATGVSAETARRYLRGERPSTQFIERVCLLHGISANWLLLGIGPKCLPDLPLAYAKLASSDLLVDELAERAKQLLASGAAAIELKPSPPPRALKEEPETGTGESCTAASKYQT